MIFHPEYHLRRNAHRSAPWPSRPAAPRPWQDPHRQEPRARTPAEDEIDRVVFRCRD